jgi:hypothetical protein
MCGSGSGRCAAGELCAACWVPHVTTTLQCVPDPRRDPEGYAATDASHCISQGYIDCDGPEDCAPSQYCVYGAVGLAYGAQCGEQPLESDSNCCFDCDSIVLPWCILCASDADCPAGNVCVPPPAGYLPDAGGCEPAAAVRDCSSTTRWCCDRTVGDFVAALCDPSTGVTHCSDGTVEIAQGEACAPDGYDVKSCDELDKLPCASHELECHSAARCSTMCTCEINGSGDESIWYCNALAC